MYFVDRTMHWLQFSLIAANCVVLCNAGVISYIEGYFSHDDPDVKRNVVRYLVLNSDFFLLHNTCTVVLGIFTRRGLEEIYVFIMVKP